MDHDVRPFRVGAQSYSFRKFGFEDAVRRLKELGLEQMEFCRVHFPPDPDLPGLPRIQATLAAEGIRVPCYGVEGFGADKEANRRIFDFAQRLGATVITADPAPDSFDHLDRLCEEFAIKVAIHNHGPGARYDTVGDTLKAVKDHSPLIGACVDTGHYLRSREMPHKVIETLGGRVISLHLKDWKMDGNETVLGEGDLDLVAVVRALKAIDFTGPIMMEYEESPDSPVNDMRRGLEQWCRAVDAVCGKPA